MGTCCSKPRDQVELGNDVDNPVGVSRKQKQKQKRKQRRKRKSSSSDSSDASEDESEGGGEGEEEEEEDNGDEEDDGEAEREADAITDSSKQTDEELAAALIEMDDFDPNAAKVFEKSCSIITDLVSGIKIEVRLTAPVEIVTRLFINAAVRYTRHTDTGNFLRASLMANTTKIQEGISVLRTTQFELASDKLIALLRVLKDMDIESENDAVMIQHFREDTKATALAADTGFRAVQTAEQKIAAVKIACVAYVSLGIDPKQTPVYIRSQLVSQCEKVFNHVPELRLDILALLDTSKASSQGRKNRIRDAINILLQAELYVRSHGLQSITEEPGLLGIEADIKMVAQKAIQSGVYWGCTDVASLEKRRQTILEQQNDTGDDKYDGGYLSAKEMWVIAGFLAQDYDMPSGERLAVVPSVKEDEEEAQRKEEEAKRRKLCDVLVVGEPGVGKSTILRTISGYDFKSGVAFGSGLRTCKLDFMPVNEQGEDIRNEEWPGMRFRGTPGLADTYLREKAAEAIVEALKDAAAKDRGVRILFCVTTEQGRVRPADALTIKEVLQCIHLKQDGSEITDDGNPMDHNFGLIVNQLAPRLFVRMNDESEDAEPEKQLVEEHLWGLSGFRTAQVLYLPRDVESEANTPLGNIELLDNTSARDILLAYIFCTPPLRVEKVDNISTDVEKLKEEKKQMEIDHYKAEQKQAERMKAGKEAFKKEMDEKRAAEARRARQKAEERSALGFFAPICI